MRDGKAVRCGCVFERSIQQKLPKLYHSAKLSDFSAPITEAVIDWLQKPTSGIFICGPTGTGKTHLAAGIVRTSIRGGKRVIFKRTADIFQDIRASFKSQDEQSEASVLAEYLEVQLLVLDDFGSGSFSDFERQKTLDLLDSRMNALLPTVITSNWNVNQIGERMDSRIGSRLGGFRILELAGKDRRVSA